jgi:hypothetical protein
MLGRWSVQAEFPARATPQKGKWGSSEAAEFHKRADGVAAVEQGALHLA